MPTAVTSDGATTFRLKWTVSEWVAVSTVLAGLGGFLLQGDRRMANNEAMSQANLERIAHLTSDIRDINTNIAKLVDERAFQERINQKVETNTGRLDRLEARVYEKP